MDQPQPPEPPPDDNHRGDDTAEDDLAARGASIVEEWLDVWTSQWERWYSRSKERRVWNAEDVVGDHTDLFEHLTPVAERSIDLTIELLRPWAKNIQARADD